MTLHLELDDEMKAALAAMAKRENMSLEEAASDCLKIPLAARKAQMAKIRQEVKKGFNSPLVKNFRLETFLDEMKRKHIAYWRATRFAALL